MDDVLNSGWQPDLGDGHYQNPVLYADYSDPDIVCVGDNIYMVASSFNHIPGLPVLHSTDLVNWKIINHVVQRINYPAYDNMQPGKGIWAPSIRYHNGLFWVFYSMPDEGIFMSYTADPAKDWSEPHCIKAVKGWIDPCPFWDDDGRAWLVHAFAYSRSGIKHQLQLCEMAPDATSLLDEGSIIFDGAVSHPTIEGPKMYWRNGWYYIFAPAGGVESGWQTVLRSRQINGPFEARDVLHQGTSKVNGPHQGGWVELKNGECWFMHFQDAAHNGRIVHLQPMRWKHDDWPEIGEKVDDAGPGQPVSVYPKPMTGKEGKSCKPQTTDRFADGRFGLQWQWQANPQRDWIIPSPEGLKLVCRPFGARSLYDTPQLLLQKLSAPQFTVTTRLTPHFNHDGEQSGLIVYGERYGAVSVCRQEGGWALVFDFGWMSDKGVLSQKRTVLSTLIRNEAVFIRAEILQRGVCHFSFRQIETEEWKTVEPQLAISAGKWVGAKIGIYSAASGLDSDAGYSEFSYFEVKRY
ncbi:MULTISPECIES: glycoside hydrolase 43 family protein [Rahnella]|uniref:glycoside hydrolase family 43 protein n=1 Tax=Rahnella TaxID=34037 RepID=UPI001EE61256|nr:MULTISPECIES: glycoside hydrolase 43 family protein [Rahnella]